MFGNLATSLKSNTVGRIYSIRKILFQSLLPFHFISMHPGRCHVLSLAHPYWTISATTQSHTTHAISFDYRVSTGHSVIIWRLLVRKTKLYSFVSTIKQSTLITQSLVVININYYSLFCKVRLLSESFHLLCPAFLPPFPIILLLPSTRTYAPLNMFCLLRLQSTLTICVPRV